MQGAYSIRSRRVRKMMVQQTGTYDQQVRRSYQLNWDNRIQNQLLDAAATSQRLNPTHMTTGYSQLVELSATPEASIDIINGWNTPRLRFWLELVLTDQMNHNYLITIQGYTEYADTSMGGLVDPNMLFMIDKVTQCRLSTYGGDAGSVERAQVSYAGQLVSDTTYAQRGGLSSQVKNYSLSPEQLFTNMQNKDLRQAAQFSEDPMSSFLVDTSTITTGSGAIPMNSRHGVGSQYAADILNTYMDTKTAYYGDADASYQGNFNDEFYTTCARKFNQDYTAAVMKDDFLNFVANRRNSSMSLLGGCVIQNTFTLQDLREYDRDFINPTLVPANSGLYSQGMGQDLGGGDIDTQFTSTVISSVTSLMTAMGIHALSFTATNMAANSRDISLFIVEVLGLNNRIDMSNEIRLLHYRILNEVLNPLSCGGNIGFDLEFKADTGGDTWVELQIEGGIRTLYVAPTFCASLTTPLVTSARTTLDDITSDLDRLGEEMLGARMARSFGKSDYAGADQVQYDRSQEFVYNQQPLNTYEKNSFTLI